ncbi:hypothetical protein Ahy_A08g040166 [Arachis hypogaea]|uniref:Uncharacterized protein n=1 Tax=Arachis hypogaea TaxID=3818 RepID=A0A445BYD2_ARAHY|nr:hypothetical protein Ahy_A08g040166 [Arachis hypogaea]
MQHNQNVDIDHQLPEIKIHHPSAASAASTPTPTAGARRKIDAEVAGNAAAGSGAPAAVVAVKEGEDGEAVIKPVPHEHKKDLVMEFVAVIINIVDFVISYKFSNESSKNCLLRFQN